MESRSARKAEMALRGQCSFLPRIGGPRPLGADTSGARGRVVPGARASPRATRGAEPVEVDTCASRPLASAAARWRLARSSQPPGAAPAASAGHVPTSPVSRASYAPTPTVPSPVLLLRLRPGLTLWHGTDCLASPPLLCFALLAQLILALSTVPFPSPCLARLARKHFPPSLLTRRVIF